MSYPARAEELGKYDNRVLHILQSSRTGTSSTDSLVGVGSYRSAYMQSAYSTAPADCAKGN